MKVCKVCNKNESEVNFEKVKGRNGKIYLRGTCYKCKWDREKIDYKYDDKMRIRHKNYVDSNRDKVKDMNDKWRKNNPEKLKEYRKRYQELIKSDPIRALKEKIRHIIKNSFKRVDYSKNERTENILGCKYEYFIKHIEKQFKDGMSWDNHGEWHFDHIIPISSAKTEEEVMNLNHYTNFQPLWAFDNLKKGKKLT